MIKLAYSGGQPLIEDQAVPQREGHPAALSSKAIGYKIYCSAHRQIETGEGA